MGKFTKTEKSWIMYDWANSIYATIIMAAIFPIYFSATAAGKGVSGDIYWGYATSIATFLIAVSAPLLGALGDFKGVKKKLFSAFLFVGVGFTLVMAATDNIMLMLVGYVVSYIGFAGSNLFYDSFLTDVTTNERMDKVSAYGYAMGYVGGSTIGFLVAIVLIMFGDKFGIDTVLATKISVVWTSLWWAVFSVPMLKNVHQKYYVERPKKNFTKEVFARLKGTLKSIVSDKGMFFFVLAYFFYIDGVGTIIHMATSYGSTLGLGANMMIIALMVTQIVAVPCSILFSYLSGKIGTIKMLKVGIGVYILVCLVGFYMGFSLEPFQQDYQEQFSTTMAVTEESLSDASYTKLVGEGKAMLSKPSRSEDFYKLAQEVAEENPSESTAVLAAGAVGRDMLSQKEFSQGYDNALQFSTVLFIILSVLVGTSQGGIQALSRSYFGRIIPVERSNEFFGFFDVFGKFAAVIGPMLYAFASHVTGRPSIGIISIAILFIGALVLLRVGRDHLKENGNNLV